MFVTRLLSGIVLVILFVGILYLGGPVTGVAMGIISLIGIFELMRVYKLEKRLPGILAYLATLVFYGFLILGKDMCHLTEILIAIGIVFLLLLLAVYVTAFPKYKDRDIMAAYFSFFYVSMMLSYVYRIRILPHGGYFVVLIFLCSWGNDTLAYCTGRLFGKHKMSPVLSPKKSVEGLIGGIVGAGLLGAVFGLIYMKNASDPVGNIPLFAAITAVGAIPAVIGDLAASAIKRNNEIKDYGKLIPGHGGILDRFDSMLFTAPIIYYAVRLWML